MYDIQQYYKAQNVDDALRLLLANPNAKLIAGGTDVLIQLHSANKKYAILVDIHALPELKGIDQLSNGTLRVGSGSTFADIINSSLVQKYIPALAEAVSTIAGPQIRNVATIGGNICNGATSADSAALSLVFGAQVEIVSPTGKRITPLEDFYIAPGKVAIANDELASAILFPKKSYENTGASYHKYAMRKAMDIAIIGCAACCRIENDRFSMLKLAYGVAAPTPVRAKTAEAAGLGKPANAQTFAAIREAVEKDVFPRSSWRASKEFRLQIIRTLAERVVAQAAKNAGGIKYEPDKN